MGRLGAMDDTDQFYTTRNPVIPEYNWPYGRTVITRNAELTKTQLSFSSITGKAKHFYDHLENCLAGAGYCYSKERLYTFKPFEVRCGYTGKPPKTNLQMQIHIGGGNQYYLIRNGNLAFTQLLRCPERINACHKNTTKFL